MSQIQLWLTASLRRGRYRKTWPSWWQTWMLQPVAQPLQTLAVSVRYHTRFWKRKSLFVSAPTGQMSARLPWYWWLRRSPGKMPISVWLPRLNRRSSPVLVISSPKRTQREHCTQRSESSMMRSPMSWRFGLVTLASVNLDS